MNNCTLNFVPLLNNKNLVPINIIKTVEKLNYEHKDKICVAEINPSFANGVDLCKQYNIELQRGVNCLVVKGIRGEKETIAILLVPVGYKYNMSSVVRKEINARIVSAAPLEYVLEKSNMEYGSITPIGLPEDWLLFIDPLVMKNEQIIIGGGYKNVKLSILSEILLLLPNAKILEGLAKKACDEK